MSGRKFASGCEKRKKKEKTELYVSKLSKISSFFEKTEIHNNKDQEKVDKLKSNVTTNKSK